MNAYIAGLLIVIGGFGGFLSLIIIIRMMQKLFNKEPEKDDFMYYDI
jgi:hypothetical protein